MISTEAIVNEERNPQQEIILLKNEIEELKKQIETLTKPKVRINFNNFLNNKIIFGCLLIR